MVRGLRWLSVPVRVSCGALITLAWLSGAAHAKPWAKWAPSPLASDSAYAALSALPQDSLGTAEFAWVEVQRDWRAQRLGESENGMHGIASSGVEHSARPADGRFARLASQPFSALGESERAWLITENAAQRAARGGSGSYLAGGILLGAVVGGLAALVGLAYAIGHTTWFP
jgi:hypothetical protein